MSFSQSLVPIPSQTTIRFHLGDESEVVKRHNRRDPSLVALEPHIDPVRPCECWAPEVSVEDAFETLFGEAVAEYDARQRRKDRRIGDASAYLEQVRTGKRGRARKGERASRGTSPEYEVIVGVGSFKHARDEDGDIIRDPETGEPLRPYMVPVDVAKAVLLEWFEGFKARARHLFVTGCWWHADEEGAPHLHVDFVPWADGYARGLERQCSLSRALEQDGHAAEGMRRSQVVVWSESEREVLEDLARRRMPGIQILHPDKGAGKVSQPTRVYKARRAAEELADAQALVAELADEAGDLEAELDIMRRRLEEYEEAIEDRREAERILQARIDAARERARRERLLDDEGEDVAMPDPTRRAPALAAEDAQRRRERDLRDAAWAASERMRARRRKAASEAEAEGRRTRRLSEYAAPDAAAGPAVAVPLTPSLR